MKQRLKYLAAVCLLLAAMLLTACSRTDYAENQAYAVMLGIDIKDDASVLLTVKYPTLAGSGNSSGGSEESSSYATTSAYGSDFQQAITNLRIKMPREINLSALTLIIISDDVIESGMLSDILHQLAANYRMYSSAYIAVCEGNAGEFIKAQEPQIGSRLSEGLKALIENAEKLGSIPDSRTADIIYSLNSYYSDPIIMLCRTTGDKSESQTEYAGSCVLKKDDIAVRFSETDTVIANMLMGDVKQFAYSGKGVSAFISVDKRPSLKVKISDGIPVIHVHLDLSAMLEDDKSTLNELESLLYADVESVINTCIAAGAEPFGFADRAASNFMTLDKWQRFNWYDRFGESELILDIQITQIF